MTLRTAALLPFFSLLQAGVRALDCSGDGIPDIIGQGPGKDCDGNSRPDACDLATRFVLEGVVFEAPTVHSFVAVDLDADGDADLGVIDNPRESYLLFNDGRGFFPSVIEVSYPLNPRTLHGDLDGDGDIDLILGALPYINQGQGKFIEGNRLDLEGRSPLLLGDLDSDGDLDIVGGTPTPPLGEMAAFLQGIGGAFSSPEVLGPSLEARSVCLDDFDADGRNDLGIATDFRVLVLRNRGSLPFDPSGEYTLGNDPGVIFDGDVDADGDTDLVTLNVSGGFPPRNNMSVFANPGDGAFLLPRNYFVPMFPTPVRLVDLDADLDLDVVGVNEDGQSSVFVSWNEGDLGFRVEEVWISPFHIGTLDALDLDGDGDIDIAVSVSTQRRGMIVLLRNTGGGNLQGPPFESEKWGVIALATGDFDGDGDPDVASAGIENPRLSTWVNEGGLRISGVRTLDRNPTDLQTADLDADGDLDLALAAEDVSFFSNGGRGDFEPMAVEEDLPGAHVMAADLDGDGLVDLAATHQRTIRVSLQAEGRGFGEPVIHQLGGFTWSITAAEVNGDGKLDLLAAGQDVEPLLWLLRNRGSADFLVSRSEMRSSPETLEAADLDGDGDVDVALDDQVLEGNGDGTFSPGRTWSGHTGGGMALRDLDSDGDVDVAAARDRQEVAIHFNSGRGFFAEPLNRAAGRVSAVVAADFDGDGDSDLALGREDRGLLVLQNEMEPTNRDCNGNWIPDSCEIAAGLLIDADGDGLADDCGSILFTRGDVDMSIAVDITDAIRILDWLFTGGEPLPCHSSADTDDNAAVDLTDAIFLLRFLFLSGDPPPSPPFPSCGKDPTIDDLGCGSARTCPR